MPRNLILFILITISFIASCEEGFDLNTGITLSEKNELYSLELNVSNNVTDDFSPVHFNAKVKRHADYNITSDSRILGSWSLYFLTIDGDTTNVAQFPTNYLFYADQTFDKTEVSTVGGEDLYSNGVWTADNNTGTMTITMAGETTTINFTFDHSGFIVPMDGFMVWDYS